MEVTFMCQVANIQAKLEVSSTGNGVYRAVCRECFKGIAGAANLVGQEREETNMVLFEGFCETEGQPESRTPIKKAIRI